MHTIMSVNYRSYIFPFQVLDIKSLFYHVCVLYCTKLQVIKMSSTFTLSLSIRNYLSHKINQSINFIPEYYIHVQILLCYQTFH